MKVDFPILDTGFTEATLAKCVTNQLAWQAPDVRQATTSKAMA